MNTTLGTGAFHTGESYSLTEDRLWKRNGSKPGVTYCHGAAGTGLSPTVLVSSGQRAMIRAIAREFPVISSDWGGQQTWGCSAAQNPTYPVRDRVIEAIDGTPALIESVVGARHGKVPLVGTSMGSFSTMGTALARPDLVACIVIVLGLVDMDDIHTNDRGGAGYQAIMNLIYGITNAQLVPAGFNPMLNTAALSAIPGQIWSSPDDPIGLNSLAHTFATATGWEIHDISPSAPLGHSEAAIAAIDFSQIVAFIQSHT